MQKRRVVLIHGWDGTPYDSWKTWLKRELEQKRISFIAPQMSGGENPRVETWLLEIAKAVGVVDENTYFVGHSLGCIAIARYLATLPKKTKVGGCVFVAGFSGNLDIPQISEFYSLPFDPEQVKIHTNKFVAILSDNDDSVPIEIGKEFAQQIGATIIIEHNKGHMTESDGVRSLPSARDALFGMMR